MISERIELRTRVIGFLYTLNMDVIQAAILGVIEGITEFLPISSTGHLILSSKLLGIPLTPFVKTFEIAIQLGAIFAVVALYWQKLLLDKNTLKKVLVAFLPSAIIGFVFYPLVKGFLLGSSEVVIISLFIGGIILIILEKTYKPSKTNTGKLGDISYHSAFLIGIFQSISIIPGVSRAGSTIIGGLIVGLNRVTSVEFSFLLAVPTMLAATSYDLYKSYSYITNSEFTMLATGFIVSFVVAAVTIKLFLGYIKKNNFTSFGIYRILLAIFYWLLVK